MPLIQIWTYAETTREQKEAFAKAITNAALEILKAERQHVTITYDQRSSENWYFSEEQSYERRDFGIPSMCIQQKDI
jgi:phenylpyruvate tautomerase PptA (4-oxalocrotonate tautomerase family)